MGAISVPVQYQIFLFLLRVIFQRLYLCIGNTIHICNLLIKLKKNKSHLHCKIFLYTLDFRRLRNCFYLQTGGISQPESLTTRIQLRRTRSLALVRRRI